MRGNLPEEDGVDHRVGPQPWLADGAADGVDAGREEEPFQADEAPFAAETQPYADEAVYADETPYAVAPVYPAQSDYPAEPAGEAGDPGAEYPNGNSAHTGSAPAGGDQGMPPPYPAQLPYQVQKPSTPGIAARLKPSFLARSKTGAAKPERPPKAERSPKTMTARVTAPFQARPKPGEAKTAKTPKTAKPSKTAKRSKVAAASAVPKGPVSTRKAQLILSRIEPWSVMKFSFMVSLVGWVVLFVAVTVLYFVLSKLGVFHSIQTTIGSVTSSKGSPGVDAGGGWFSASRVLGYTMLVGAVNVVLITALATVAAVIYNLVTHIAGGIEVTLKETD